MQFRVGSLVLLDLQGEGGAGLGLGLQPPSVDGVHHMWEGDGGHWSFGLEGGHVRHKVCARGGGGGLHGVEPSRVGHESPSDRVLFLFDCGSTGSSWSLSA